MEPQNAIQGGDGKPPYLRPDKEAYIKYANQVIASEGFDVDVVENSDICGEIQPCRTDTKYVVGAANFAFQKYNEIEGAELKLAKIIKVNMGFQCDVLYCMTLEATDGNFYEAKVYYCGGGVYEYNMFRKALFYPKLM